MSSQENKKPLPPRPMRKNTLLSLLAGAATIIVVSGNMACRPLDIGGGNTLGIYAEDGIEWGAAGWEDFNWEDYIRTGDSP